MRLSLKKAYVGAGLKHVLAAKQGFTKALQALLPKLEDEKEEGEERKSVTTRQIITRQIITRHSRLVPSLIFQVQHTCVHEELYSKSLCSCPGTGLC